MEVVETYNGVNIIKSCNYYYPAFNGNFESKDVQEVKDYIDNCIEMQKEFQLLFFK